MLRRSFLTFLLAAPVVARGATARIAHQGRVLLPVTVGVNASPKVRQIAGDLAVMLGRMVGADVPLIPGDGTAGVAVGLPQDFPALGFGARWALPTPEEREDYLIQSTASGVLLLGASELAVEDGVWALLHRLGHRQFFPGARWEVVPKLPDLSVQVSTVESPSYRSRSIWYGYGPWDYAGEPYRAWTVRNRVRAGVQLNTGHAYSRIIRALHKEFDSHPEFHALANGERKATSHAKFCIGNPELRRAVVAYALDEFRRTPTLDSISMEPSDGGGWCECPLCKAIGTVSDQVVLLANEVAAAVAAQHPGKLVGLYAYDTHSPPPSLRVHPNIVVSVATAFIKDGFTIDELIAAWVRQGAAIGIREYYSVNPWDRDQPARARGSNVSYLTRTITAFHAVGARFLSAEASDNWGPNGLGYYVASRLLWDVQQASAVDGLVEDFLGAAFGAARESMRDFYRQLDGATPHLVSDDQIGRMFRALAQARVLAAADSAVQGRLDDLLLYTRYCSLYDQYARAGGERRQAAFEALVRHAYRMRTTMMVHAKALYRDLAHRDRTVSIPLQAAWNVPEGKNPWKDSRPFRSDELASFLAEGIRRHPLDRPAFAAVSFGDDLRPAAPLGLADTSPGEWSPGRGVQAWIVYVSEPRDIHLRITGGLIAHYRDRGPVRVSVWRAHAGTATAADAQPELEDKSTPPDGREHEVQLVLREAGLYRIIVNDGMDRTRVVFPPDLAVVLPSSAQEPMNRYVGDWSAWFYVPRRTKIVGLFGGGHGEVQDSHGRTVWWLNGTERGYHAVPVPEGEDGKAWRIVHGRGDLRLLTVPPYFALSPGSLLLPAEVLQADR